MCFYFSLNIKLFCYFVFLLQPLPFDFVRRYINNYEGDALLLVPNARFWYVQLHTRSKKTEKLAPRISTGWKAFAEDNNLQLGDACVFELVSRMSFQVYIFRSADYDTNRRRSQCEL